MPATNVPNIETKKFDITNCVHPHYSHHLRDWLKWRYTYEGGDVFIDRYLERFSSREDQVEFGQRKKMSYCPAFAKNALKRARNTVFSRGKDISRTGGPKSYQDSISGKNNGVDLGGASMNYFMGVKCLDEAMAMSGVGIYVDMPRLQGPTLLEKGAARPYLYMYSVEDIRSWAIDPECPSKFTSLLLVDHNYDYETETGLVTGSTKRFRHLYLRETDEGLRLFVRFYDTKGEVCNCYGETVEEYYEEQVGEMSEIPFHYMDLGNSLLADAANYQIAHMNIASGDVWYAARGNFPFYVEPFDPRANSPYIRSEGEADFDEFDVLTSTTTTTHSDEIGVGPTRGRKYPMQASAPAFIHPSTEPLLASMKKQEQMKEEIRDLINQNLENLTGTTGDDEILSGLNYIAYVLQHAENRIAHYWSMYEGSKDVATVVYPDSLEIKLPKDQQAEVANLLLLIDKVPQGKFKKELLKLAARIKLAPNVSRETLLEVYAAIDAAKVVLADPVNVIADVNAGLVSNATASEARGYPKGESDKAAEDHLQRVERIAESQAKFAAPPAGSGDPQARGVKDLSANPDAGKQEKAVSRDTTHSANQEDLTRGDGKAPNA